MGKSVVVVEETDWLGGQLTSQGVPPDEHPWIEQFGCTRSYRRFREGVRAFIEKRKPNWKMRLSRPMRNWSGSIRIHRS